MRLKNYIAKLSFRDTNSGKYIGDSKVSDTAEEAIQTISQKNGLQPTVVLGEAAFYGPKVDFIVKDILGQSWQLGTVQLDYQLPIRFDLTYMGADGQKHQPVMIHRATFGSLERFIAIVIEQTGGKFPLWLATEQVALLSLSDKYNGYATVVQQNLLEKGIRVTLDIRNETMGGKFERLHCAKSPIL